MHLPKTKETLGLIGDEALQGQADGYIVNAARGGIVDETALYEDLGRRSGRGRGVGRLRQGAMHRLTAVRPRQRRGHTTLGASTDEAQEKAGIAVAKSVRQALAGELVPDAVNVRSGAIAEPVRPYLSLVEKLGRLCQPSAPAPIAKVSVDVVGELSEHDVMSSNSLPSRGCSACSLTSRCPIERPGARRRPEVSIPSWPPRATSRITARWCASACRVQTAPHWVAGTVTGLHDDEKLVLQPGPN